MAAKKKPTATPKESNDAGFGSDVLPSRYSDEEIAARQAAFEARGPVIEVTRDNWENEIENGNPFDEAARPYREANPHLHLRYLSPRHCKMRGTRGYEKLIDPRTGRSVRVGMQELHYIPKDVQEQRVRRTRREVEDNMKRRREEYKEMGRKAQVDSGGAIRFVVAEDEIIEGNRRVA